MRPRSEATGPGWVATTPARAEAAASTRSATSLATSGSAPLRAGLRRRAGGPPALGPVVALPPPGPGGAGGRLVSGRARADPLARGARLARRPAGRWALGLGGDRGRARGERRAPRSPLGRDALRPRSERLADARRARRAARARGRP